MSALGRVSPEGVMDTVGVKVRSEYSVSRWDTAGGEGW